VWDLVFDVRQHQNASRMIASVLDDKTDGMDDLGRSEAIVQCSTTPFDKVRLFTLGDNRVGITKARTKRAFLRL
jgi:hypothetical protein